MPPSARDVLERYRSDPVAFFEERLGYHAWSRQRAIAEAVRDYPRVGVRSAHGIGKSSVAARIGLWYLSAFPGSRVIVTAPTSQQLRNVFWREVALAYRAAGGFIGGELLGDRLEIADDWFMVALSTDRPERFQGHHAEHLLLIVDEASGVHEEIFEAASGFLTSPESRLLLIGNPTRTSGEFFDAFHSARGHYKTIQISAFDTPAFTGERVPSSVLRKLVSRRWVEDHARKWGEGSPLYQVRIAAEFPDESDDVVVGLADLEAARRRTLAPGLPLVLSVDVARFGSDLTTFAVRRGDVVRIVKSYGGRDTMRTVGEVTKLARELEREHGRKPTVVLDDAGVGGGVTDRLRELNEFQIVAYNSARSALAPDDYPRARDEDWFGLAERLPQIDLDPADEELAADLLAPRYTLDSQARRVVEKKSETKKRIRRSPDRGDAVVMAFAIDKRRPLRSFVPRGRIGASRTKMEAKPEPAGPVARVPAARSRAQDNLDQEIGAFLGVDVHRSRIPQPDPPRHLNGRDSATPSRPRGGGASTSRGHPHTVFRRVLERGNLLVAEATAKELPRIGLADALDLTLLIARKEPRRTRAAAPAGYVASSRSTPRRRSTRR